MIWDVPRAPSISLDPDRELDELREYLGEAYDHQRLVHWDETLEDEHRRIGDEAKLYRTSEAYLYNLTAFAMSLTKLPYLRDLARLTPRSASLLDYGCGIGSDGLALIEAGYDVSFADFDNPSTRYLRWRLERRGLEATIYDLDSERVPGGFDAAYSLDVIEHVDEPFAFLEEMERVAGLVAVNFLDPEPGETDLHRELPVADLLDHVAERTLRRYRLYHGRSHLVLYSPRPRGALGRLRSRLALAIGRRLSPSPGRPD